MISSRCPRPIGIRGVNRLEAGLHGRVHRVARDDTGRHALDRARLGGGDGAALIQRLAERIDDAPDQGIADGHLEDAPGGPHLVILADERVVAEDRHGDRVLFQVEGHAHQAGSRELDSSR